MKPKLTGLNVLNVYEPLLEVIREHTDKFHSQCGANLGFIIPASVDLTTWASNPDWLSDDPIRLLIEAGVPRDIATHAFNGVIRDLGLIINEVMEELKLYHLHDARISASYYLILTIS